MLARLDSHCCKIEIETRPCKIKFVSWAKLKLGSNCIFQVPSTDGRRSSPGGKSPKSGSPGRGSKGSKWGSDVEWVLAGMKIASRWRKHFICYFVATFKPSYINGQMVWFLKRLWWPVPQPACSLLPGLYLTQKTGIARLANKLQTCWVDIIMIVVIKSWWWQ